MDLAKRFWWIILIAVILRITFALTTFHPDIVHFDLAGQVLTKGHVLDLYDFSFNPSNDYLYEANRWNRFNYPPLVYFLHGSFASVFLPFTDSQLLKDFALDYTKPLGDIKLNFHLLALKLPYLFFDLGIAFLLSGLFSEQRKRLLAFIFWLFNPLTFYASYMMGQFDVIPTFFTVLALYLAKRRKLEFAALSIGIGAAFKIYPAFFLIPLILTEKKWISRIKLMFIGVVPYLLLIAPFLFSSGFRSTALVASQTDKSFFAKIPISGGEAIILFPLFIAFFYFVFYFREHIELWKSFFIILITFFIFTHFHPQWYLWLTPFLIISLINSNFKNWLVVIVSFLSFLGMVTFFDPSLSVGLFSPVFPGLFDLPSIWELVGLKLDINFARSLLQTVFAATGIYFIYESFQLRTNE